MLHKDYPDILDSGLVDKVMNYHELQNKARLDRLRYQEKSNSFLEREILNDIGKGIDSAGDNASIAEREK